MDRAALLLPLNMYSNSVSLFLCLSGPVPPAGVLTQTVEASAERGQSVHLYIVVAIKPSRNEVRVPLLWNSVSQSYPTVSIFKSYYVNILQTCMIQKDMKYVSTLEDLYRKPKLLFAIVYGKMVGVNCVSSLFSASGMIGKLLEYMEL